VTPVTEEAQDMSDSHEPEAAEQVEDLVEEDLLVEDVSIDGMCGVY
jgi:mycofactocin precursor